VLDAPNLRVNAVRDGDTVAAVNLLAAEGGLSPDQSAAYAAGRGRLRGHALADSLVVHLGRPEAGPLRMLRSVRIATAPRHRRRGLAGALVEAAHASPDIDLFGTVFGATPELLGFRRRLGYRLVRVGSGRGARTGAPAAVMVRPVGPGPRALVADLRRELSRNLPHQLALLRAEPGLGLDPALAVALSVGLPSPAPLPPSALRRALLGYTAGPRTADAVHFALVALVDRHPRCLARLPPAERRLIEARVRHYAPWEACADLAGLVTVRAAQRGLRRAVRGLARAAGLLSD
jgi:tRNA(Met) cytidine acetyltransferase